MNDNVKQITEEFLTYFEGKKLFVYLDTAGKPTCGLGHLVRQEDNLRMGDTITPERLQQLFINDLNNAEKRVQGVVNIPLDDNEYAALLSQAFNLNSFETLAGHLKVSKEKYKQRALLYYRDIKLNKVNGLLIRRICERLLFEGREWKEVARDLQMKRNLDYTIKIQKELFN